MAELYRVADQHLGPKGDGHYAAYHALWHLFEIGVVDDLATFASAAWDAAEEKGRPTRVALIDVSVAYEHPNLKYSIGRDLMIDFFSARLGAFPFARAAEDPRLAGFCADAGVVSPLPGDPLVTELFDELRDSLTQTQANAARPWNTPLIVQAATNPAFCTHGTAMAGIIGARPVAPGQYAFVDTVKLPVPGQTSGALPLTEPRGFPYSGVDPYCEIVPVSTSFDPDPEQLILALLYAHLIGADMIVTARDYADPLGASLASASGPHGGIDPEERRLLEAHAPTEIGARERALWKSLGVLTVEISKRIPIVCAAGNGGDETIILPAALARPDNGIIAVGARAATGRRAGYSSTGGPAGPQITVYAPSGDGDRLDEELVRLDTASPGFRRSEHSAAYRDKLGVRFGGNPATPAPPITPNVFSTQEIVSVDVPGAGGYSRSPYTQPTGPGAGILDYRAYFCHFSGTSAASAIAGGMLSLAMAAGRAPRGDGVGAKNALTGGAPPDDDAATPALSWAALPASRGPAPTRRPVE